MTDANACETTRCYFIEKPLEECAKRACPFRWQREGREARQRQQDADRRRWDALPSSRNEHSTRERRRI